MKRRILFLLIVLTTVAFWAVPVRAAAEESVEPSSPLYSPPQGLITGICTIVIFILLLVVLGRFAWGPIVKGLSDREKKIRNDIAEAEAARAKAEALLRDYNKQLADAEERARGIITKAGADAEALASQIRTRAQQEAEEARERATKDIEVAKNQAIRDIYEQSANLATNVAEKIIRKSLNPNDYRDMVEQSLGQLESMKN